VNSIKQQNAHKRIVQIVLDDDCLIHMEIISCEKQINELIDFLSKKYCMKQIFISKKEEK